MDLSYVAAALFLSIITFIIVAAYLTKAVARRIVRAIARLILRIISLIRPKTLQRR